MMTLVITVVVLSYIAGGEDGLTIVEGQGIWPAVDSRWKTS